MNKITVLTAAITGMLLASGCSTTKSTAASNADLAQGECHGVNGCKGKGDCGGKGYSCAGKNSCKGKGWLKLSKAECDEKGGKFKSM